jgi:hypothetical protein
MNKKRSFRQVGVIPNPASIKDLHLTAEETMALEEEVSAPRGVVEAEVLETAITVVEVVVVSAAEGDTMMALDEDTLLIGVLEVQIAEEKIIGLDLVHLPAVGMAEVTAHLRLEDGAAEGDHHLPIGKGGVAVEKAV